MTKIGADVNVEFRDLFATWCLDHDKRKQKDAIVAAIKLLMCCPEELRNHAILGRDKKMKDWFRDREKLVAAAAVYKSGEEASRRP